MASCQLYGVSNTPLFSLNTPSRLQILVDWCKDAGVTIDSRLDVRDTDEVISVHALDEIEPLVTVVRIPKAAVLSVKSSDINELHDASIHGREAQLALALALYIEMQKGVSSRWHGYLQSLPTHIVDIPLFWPAGDPAISLCGNTEIERKMSSRGTTDMTMLEEFYAFYEEMVVPIYTKHLSVKPSMEGFQRAYSLVSSRAFLVDAYHGLAMVPIADAFNHAQDNHVHLESEFDVCPECGALRQCPHDSPPSSPISASSKDSDPGYFEMVTNTLVLAGGEVFNTYGEDLSNADLLIRYGFMSDVNDNDRVSWDFAETERLPVLDFSALEDTELVWLHEGPTAEFYINSDGMLSHPLFLRLSGIRDQVGLNELFASLDALSRTAMSVLELCTRRELADLADVDIESVSPRTRLVTLEIMAEQAILETCMDKWRAFLDEDESS